MSIYTEVRHHLEALAAQQPGALEAAQRYLAAHCCGCGTTLSAEPQEQHGWCERCELPEALPLVSPADAAHSADPAYWPAGKVQETVRRLWSWPAVQTLLGDLERLGITLPIRDRDGGTASQAQRQALYSHAEAMGVIVRARASQLGVRHLAALLFGSQPGGASDEIARKLKEVAPSVLAVPPLSTSAPAASLSRAHQPPPPVPPRTPKVRAPKPPREKKPPRVAARSRPAPAPAPSPIDPSHPAAAWPPKLQAQAQALWDKPAAVQLRADLATLGLSLPLPRGTDRREILGRPDVLAALASAYKAGLGQRALALLVLGSPPGSASDDIGHLLDQHDPSIRVKRSKA